MSSTRPEVWQRRGPTWEPVTAAGRNSAASCWMRSRSSASLLSRQPDAMRAREDAEVDAAAARGAGLDLERGEVGAQAVEEGVGAAGLRGVGGGEDAVVVPFQIVDRVRPEDRGERGVQVVADLRAGHVEDTLVAPFDLVVRSEQPVGMRAGEVAVGIGHLGLDPEAEGHPLGVDVVDQGGEAVGPFAGVDGPVAQGGRVVVAPPEPAVVEDEALRAKPRGAGGDVHQRGGVVVEIDRLPAIVVHGARAGGVGPRHDPVADVALERGGAAVEAGAGIGRVERRGLEPGAGRGLGAGRVAELDLAAAVGQLFRDHAVPARPAVVERPRLAARVRRAAGGDDEAGEVLVPGAAGAVLAAADAGRPGRPLELELPAPAARDVDHLGGGVRAGQDRGGEPVAGGRGRRRRAWCAASGRGWPGRSRGGTSASVRARRRRRSARGRRRHPPRGRRSAAAAARRGRRAGSDRADRGMTGSPRGRATGRGSRRAGRR